MIIKRVLFEMRVILCEERILILIVKAKVFNSVMRKASTISDIF